MAQTQNLSKNGNKKASVGGRKPTDLSEFYALPIIAQKIDTGLYKADEIREYMLNIKRIFQNVDGLKRFLDLDADHKGKFLMDWVAAYLVERTANASELMKLNTEDVEACAQIANEDRCAFNSGWMVAWKIQGLFSNVLNMQNAINITRFPQFIPNAAGKPLKIKKEDIFAVFEKLKPVMQFVLQMQALYGAQPVDLLDLRVADFQDAGDGEYYIVKYRKKTQQKNTVWFALVPQEIVEAAKAIAKVNNKTIMEPLLGFKSESAIRGAYAYAAEKWGVVSLDTPELRRYNATTLSKTLKVAEKELYVPNDPATVIDRDDILHFWTQHDVDGVLSANYIRDHIAQMKSILPWIYSELLINSTRTFTKKLAAVEKKAKDIAEQNKAEIQKNRDESFRNTNETNKLLLEFLGQIGKKVGVEIKPHAYTNNVSEEEKNVILTKEIKDAILKFTNE